MKKLLIILIAGIALSINPASNVWAQTTKSGAPVIPIPSGDVRSGAPKPGSAPKIQIGKAETAKLKNGLTVIVVENHKLPRVSFQIFVDYDPVLEKDATGYVSMMGELLSKGTTTRTKAELDEQTDFIGASLFSGANGVSGNCLTKHTDKLLELMSDVLLNPAFPEEELAKAKTRAESNLASSKDDANAIAGNVASVLRYGKDHPYGEVMTEATLAKINLDQIKNHYQTYFKPNIAYLVVVGDISKADAMAKAEKYFGKWAKGDVPKHTYPVPKAPEKTQVHFVHKPGAVQSVVNITYPVTLKPGTPDVIPSSLMNTLLGGGFINSRLNLNLREDKAYTYGAYSSLASNKLIGYFNVAASVRNGVTDSAIIEFTNELNRMRTEEVGADELQMVKNVMTGQFSRSLEQPGTIANFALSTVRYNLAPDYYENYLTTLQNTSSANLKAMANKYLLPDHANILVVGNKSDVAELLSKFDSDKKISYYDNYGNPIADANQTIPEGVTPETIISDYVNAIGGLKKIETLKDVQTELSLSTPMGSLNMKMSQKGGNKVAQTVSMQGQVVSNRVYNGEKATENGMAGLREMEGEELEDMKESALFCKEAGYQSSGAKLKLTGIEMIDGKKTYVLEVERADGKKSTEYYDLESSLKVREVSTTEGPDGQSATVINDFGDYKEVNGVKFPHSITISGVFPVPMKGSVTSLKVNAGIDDSVFENK